MATTPNDDSFWLLYGVSSAVLLLSLAAGRYITKRATKDNDEPVRFSETSEVMLKAQIKADGSRAAALDAVAQHIQPRTTGSKL